MIISILHFSDIHLKNGHNVILNRRQKIFDIVKNELKGKDELFLVTSGDIAFSGKKEEYNLALDFYSKLSADIRDYTGLTPTFLFVPGNHDLLLDTTKEQVRKIVLKSFAEDGFSDLSEELINICCAPQKNYEEFTSNIAAVSSNNGDVIQKHPLVTTIIFKLKGVLLKFNLFNSSWDSSLHEKIGNMKFPVDYIYDNVPSSHSTYSISVVHHPFNWQTPQHSREFREFLIKTSEIVISGHEHQPHQSFLSDFDQEYNTIHIESPALQDSNNERESYFNIIDIDTDADKIKIIEYGYEYEKGNYSEKSQTDWKSINKNKKLKSRLFQIKKAFQKDLEDPGASYSHPTADDLKLSDLYIAPFFQTITLDTTKKRTRLLDFVHSDSALDITKIQFQGNNPEQKEDRTKTNFFKLILGAEYSGKTALLKNFYIKSYEKGYYPILLRSNRITDVQIERLKKSIEKEFKEQYDELDEKYEHIDVRKVVILLDDLHRIKDIKTKAILLKNLTRIYPNIVITGSELMMFESYVDKNRKSVDLFEDFDKYIIQEFNIALRNNLINKWYRLGVDYLEEKEKNAFFKRLDRASQQISGILGKNLIPSFPVYILTILQGLETGESETSSNKQHAYYYESLITKSLKKALKEKEDIGFYFTLSTEFCYYLFDNKIRFTPVTKEHFLKFLESHKKMYAISKPSNDQILNVLLEGKILRKDNEDNFLVAYKYLYYFFVAKYLADNIHKSDIRAKVDLMADRVYRDEYSNIIVFLTHLSRNNHIVEKLIEKSRNIYFDIEPTRLEDDVDFINELQKTLPEQVLKSINVETARQNALNDEEELETYEKDQIEKNLQENYDIDEDLNSIDVLSHLTRALRTIDILGQLTKKYWGELKGGEKYTLAEETLLLGLRTLNYIYQIFETSTEDFVEHAKRVLTKDSSRSSLSEEQVKNITENLIFSLCSATGYSTLKRIANAIGTEKLVETFRSLEEQYPHNSTKLAHVGIMLDHYSSFPMDEIVELKGANEKNPLAFSILQNFVLNYMYMFELSYDRRQKICELLKIKMEDQRVIAASSPIKKE